MILIEKQNRLKEISVILKKEFVGIDSIIDELLDMITPYYYSSGMLVKPLVINLWGLTSTGKTSLVERLVKLLDFENRFCKIDLGEKTSSLKYEMEKKLEKLDSDDPIFLFDEFQSARTIDDSGSEIKENPVRIMWEMIDTGKITFMDYNYISYTIQDYVRLLEVIKGSDITVRDGRVVRGQKAFYSAMVHVMGSLKLRKEKEEYPYFIQEEDWMGLYKLSPGTFNSYSFYDSEVFAESLLNLDLEKIELLFNKLKKCISLTKTYNFSKALIFCIGNLDEAFTMSKNLNPDTDPDLLHKRSLKITVPDIKNCLQSRFRAEQIARLGNNHLIYPALNKKDYRKLIKLYLNNFKSKWYTENKIKLNYVEESVIDLIYNEGVFPTQGVRPILSTITNLIVPVLAKAVVEFQSVVTKSTIKELNFKADNEKDLALIKIIDSKNSTYNFQYKLKLKIHSLRRPTNMDQLHTVSVHEAGHVVSSLLLANILPDKVTVCTASTDSYGFVQMQMPEMFTKDLYLKNIQVLLAGLVAEKLFLGEDLTGNGVSDDLQRATIMAQAMTRRFGMGQSAFVLVSQKDIMSDLNGIHDYKSEEINAKQNLTDCYTITEACLLNNIDFMQALINELTKKYTLTGKEILKLAKQYAVSKIDVRDPENYYQMSSIIDKNIKNLKKLNGKRISRTGQEELSGS